jgi:hypothetical protein
MTELVLTVVQPAGELGYVAGFAVTDDMIHIAGGTSAMVPMVLASSDARRFHRRTTPRELGLRGVAVLRDELWICGEFGQLARSSDHGATWALVPTSTDACLLAIAGSARACAAMRSSRSSSAPRRGSRRSTSTPARS